MLIQSFVVSNVVKGLVLSYVFILMQFVKDSIGVFLNRKQINVFRAFGIFLFVFVTWQLLAQLLNAVYVPSFENLVLISPEEPSVALFRKSMFTQSLYLFTSVIFFLYVYKYFQEHRDTEAILRIVKISVIVYVAYGFVELLAYAITGQNIDIISNRITGEDFEYGVFQVLKLGGIWVMRMKSLAGFPSMFALSILPFFIFYYYRKDKIYILFLLSLFFSTSTTAIFGLLIFVLFEVFIFRKLFSLIYVALAVVAVYLLVDTTLVIDFLQYNLDKLARSEDGVRSGMFRYEHYVNALRFFIESDVFHMLFGHGFGYIRATNGITNLLVNTGILGATAYCTFFIYPLTKLTYDSGYKKGLLVSNVVMLFSLLTSCPEFFYLHIWFFAALSWYECHREKFNPSPSG